MIEVAYKFYPSLLDRFQSLLDTSLYFESDMNWDDKAGDYRRSEEDIAHEREVDLLNAVNRVPRPPIEAADLGTCFNNVVDYLVAGVPLSCDPSVRMEMDGFTFDYDGGLCRDVATMLGGSVSQCFTQAVLPTRYGGVLLYGYPDYWCADGSVVDLKTTSRYTWPKYDRHWQRWVYPWCLREQRDAKVDWFSFLVVKWKKPTKAEPYYRGDIYKEDYAYDHTDATRRLQAVCERFVEWLEAHREMITDTKIFAQ